MALDSMPDKFWLITYGCLVWSRSKLAFVPPTMFDVRKSDDEAEAVLEDLEDVIYLTQEETVAQVTELAVLGIDAEGKHYEVTAE